MTVRIGRTSFFSTQPYRAGPPWKTAYVMPGPRESSCLVPGPMGRGSLRAGKRLKFLNNYLQQSDLM